MKTLKIISIILGMVLLFTACSSPAKAPETKDKMETTTVAMTSEEMETAEMETEAMETSNEEQMSTEAMMTNTGDPAPVFELVDVTGSTHKLSDYAGKKVYIKFWASWCSICLAGIEEVNTLAGDEMKDFVILTLVSPGYNNEKKSPAFIKWFNGVDNVSNLTVLLDEDGDLTREFGVRGYPTSAFIGSDGVLVKTQPGHLSNDQIIAEFEMIY